MILLEERKKISNLKNRRKLPILNVETLQSDFVMAFDKYKIKPKYPKISNSARNSKKLSSKLHIGHAFLTSHTKGGPWNYIQKQPCPFNFLVPKLLYKR